MSDRRNLANRINASQSTGPITEIGKATASCNATRHGILSSKLFLDDEDPDEFQQLQLDLHASLNPVGTLELALVERIAVAIWRQKRLLAAETASLKLNVSQRNIVKGINSELNLSYTDDAITEKDLRPASPEQEHWCRSVMAEIENLSEWNLQAIQDGAPLVLGQLEEDASEDGVEPVAYLADYPGGICDFLAELATWCRKQIERAEQQPELQDLATQIHARRKLLPQPSLELLTRYQTTLDNQLYKALKALREAQEWRLKSLELKADETDCEAAQAA